MHWVLSERYDFVQDHAFTLMPNKNSEHVNIMAWSIPSKAADKSSRMPASMDLSSRVSAMSL